MRRLLCAALALALAPACKQSLFDSSTGGGGGADPDAAGGVADSAPTLDAPDQPDADPAAPDAAPGPDAPDVPDAAPGTPDAASDPDAGGGIATCPSPCIGDAVADFTTTPQPTDRFAYRDDTRALFSAYADMILGTHDGVQAFLGGGATKPAILHCPSVPGYAGCTGVEDRLLLVPSAAAAGNRDPAVQWTAPLTGRIRVSGSYRVATGVSGMQQRISIRRNARPDVLYTHNYLPGTTPVSFDLTVDVVQGDRLLLTMAPPTSGTPVPVAFHLFVTDLAAPGACLLHLTFDEEPPLDLCTGAATMERNWNNGSPIAADLQQPDSFAGEFGKALRFVHDGVSSTDFLIASSGPIDYSGAFTIQFWSKVTEPPAFGAALMADWDCDAQGGVHISPDDNGTLYVLAFHAQPGQDLCQASADGGNFTRPTDGQWHFYRVVRDPALQTLSVCIDGVKVGSDGVAGGADMTSSGPLFIGRNVTYNPPYFDGQIDDLRIYKRALPCQ